jgi:hypothetical protein
MSLRGAAAGGLPPTVPIMSRRLPATMVLLVLSGAASAAPDVEVREGRVTIAAEDEPIDAVLQAVGAAAGLAVPSLAGAGETFSGRQTAVPLADFLRRLLGRRSYILLYDEAGRAERLVLLGVPDPAPDAPAVAVTETAPTEAEEMAFVEPLTPAEEERFVAERLTAREIGVRVVAIRRLDRLPAERAAVLARQVATSEPEPVIRAELADALARIDGKGTVAILQQLLRDPERSVAVAAVRALGAQGGPDAIALLGETLVQGTDQTLRQAALEELAAAPWADVDAPLRSVAERPDDPLAESAREVLTGMPAPDPPTLDPREP